MEAIYDQLLKMKEERYGAFQRKLIPTVAPETVIGVRTPRLRKLAGQKARESTRITKEQKEYLKQYKIPGVK